MSETNRTRALVLGGGGPVGVAWELGLAAGLQSGGVDLALADFVVGTSAGSLAGAMLTSGEDPAQLVDDIETMFSSGIGDSGADQVDPAGAAKFMEMTFDSGLIGNDEAAYHQHVLEVGRYALSATTIPEESLVGAIGSVMAGRPWPSVFRCAAVDTATGELKVWDEAAGVSLERAIASSCSVPGIYPPITINGARYTDGGVRSVLNADLAAGHDVAIVVSVTLLELPPGLEDPRIGGYLARQGRQLDELRDSGTDVELIVPDMEFLMLSGMGMNLMDFSLIGAAAEAGVRLGKTEADRLRDRW